VPLCVGASHQCTIKLSQGGKVGLQGRAENLGRFINELPGGGKMFNCFRRGENAEF